MRPQLGDVHEVPAWLVNGEINEADTVVHAYRNRHKHVSNCADNPTIWTYRFKGCEETFTGRNDYQNLHNHQSKCSSDPNKEYQCRYCPLVVPK